MTISAQETLKPKYIATVSATDNDWPSSPRFDQPDTA
jgi:hypothetical protein